MIPYLLVLALAACGTTANLHGQHPNLQSVNVGQPGCIKDCTLTHTATQSIGEGDVKGTTVSNTSGDRKRSTTLTPGQ